MSKQIVITFDNGAATLEAIGYTGPACEAATRAVEEALGSVVARERTPDFTRAATASTRQEARRG